jgi:hypothetical protein
MINIHNISTSYLTSVSPYIVSFNTNSTILLKISEKKNRIIINCTDTIFSTVYFASFEELTVLYFVTCVPLKNEIKCKRIVSLKCSATKHCTLLCYDTYSFLLSLRRNFLLHYLCEFMCKTNQSIDAQMSKAEIDRHIV